MTTTRLDAGAYRAAERLLRDNRGNLVLGDKVSPRWIEGGARFWYAVDTAEGRRFVLVDPVAGSRGPAFDQEKVAAALAAASGREADASALPLSGVELSGDGVEFDAFGGRWRCRVDGSACERVAGVAPVGPVEVASPDGRLVAFRRGHDVWVRSLEDGREWALTADGDADHDYGASPDFFMYSTLLKKMGLPHAPPAVSWSPDSRRVLTHRTDQQGVRRTHLVESMPDDGGAPALVTLRQPFPGDDRLPLAAFVVLDVARGTAVAARAEPVEMPTISPIFMKWAWWAQDGSAVYYLRRSRDGRTLRLHRLDPVSGEVVTVLSESGETRVEPAQQMSQAPMVRVLPGGQEVLWYSQRDGWGHLYLYDARSGEPRGQVTSGSWAVQEILHVDEVARVVYFVACGLVAADPYRRSVCRAGLDGSGFERITDDDLDHVVIVADNKGYFLDSASTTDTPPSVTVRGWDGRVLVELERADVTRLTAAGWTPPERFCVKAADGHSDVYGVLYRPHGFDPGRSYPVVDHVYPFPAVNRVSPSFDAGWHGYDAEVVAALGFVVVAVDGRGTPGRDKAFHDASYGRLDEAGLADHVAALEQLAAGRPWMDLDRVGVFGLSAGGFAAVRAMLDFPEVFKVGVVESGMHDLRYGDPGSAEAYHGPFDAQRYARASNVDLADRLVGRLLLVHGGLDTQVSPDLTLRLVDRLIAADKDFELLVVPRAEHVYVGFEYYVNRRKWDFLVRHLLGVEPPEGYRLSRVPIGAGDA
ncbi:DPP IV N-terminal domain-containing protein [Nonomuraea sp. NEAU-A123]|uniref:S9 family peptidase n=1 Tax=Nonomuraea sp. NEAU-A123 TaxID=2839649 RepID=UPI001BE47420|nr:DPP IV N-terminal domain-containing protein [Nonomuraea sp. NEAU-A123]MBT2225380.1 DPP IV N-terminal domain-containing protein [Nonomuraea sp. NEAU-A123]